MEPRSKAVSAGGHRLPNLKPKTASLAGGRFNPNAASHPLDTTTDQCQTDPGTRVGFLGVQTLKQSENLLLILRSNPDSMVGHPHPDPTVSLLRPNLDTRGLLR